MYLLHLYMFCNINVKKCVGRKGVDKGMKEKLKWKQRYKVMRDSFYSPVNGVRGCPAPVRYISQRDQPLSCSVSAPHKGTSNRIWYGVGTDRVFSILGLDIFHPSVSLSLDQLICFSIYLRVWD